MFQAQNREIIDSIWKVVAPFKIIMTTSVTRSCFTMQQQTCKTKTKTDFSVSDRFCPKTDGLRPHHTRGLRGSCLRWLHDSPQLTILECQERPSWLLKIVENLWAVRTLPQTPLPRPRSWWGGDSSPQNPGSSPTVSHVCHWWRREWHPVNIAAVHQQVLSVICCTSKLQ